MAAARREVANCGAISGCLGGDALYLIDQASPATGDISSHNATRRVRHHAMNLRLA